MVNIVISDEKITMIVAAVILVPTLLTIYFYRVGSSLTSSPLSLFTTCWAFIILVDAIAVASACTKMENNK